MVGATSLEYFYNIRDWIAPCLEELKYHTDPHIFLFKLGSHGKAEMFYKHWSKDPWLPNEGLQLLKVATSVVFYV